MFFIPLLNLRNSYIYHLIFIVLLYAKQLMASFQTSWLVRLGQLVRALHRYPKGTL